MRVIVLSIFVALSCAAEPVGFSRAWVTWAFGPDVNDGRYTQGTGTTSIREYRTEPRSYCPYVEVCYEGDPAVFDASASASAEFGVLKSRAELTLYRWSSLSSFATRWGHISPWPTFAEASIGDDVTILGSAASYDLAMTFEASSRSSSSIRWTLADWEDSDGPGYQGSFYIRASGASISLKSAEQLTWRYGAQMPSLFTLVLRDLPANVPFRLTQGTYAGTPGGTCDLSSWYYYYFAPSCEGTGTSFLDLGNSAYLRSVEVRVSSTGQKDGAKIVSANGFDYDNISGAAAVPEPGSFATAAGAIAIVLLSKSRNRLRR